MAYMHGIQVIEIGGSATIVAPVDSVAPIITSPLTATTRENAAWSMTLLADENVSFAKRTGADSAAFTLAGATLSLPAQDYEGGQTAFVCNLVAMDTAGNVTNFAVTVTVTDVDEIAPLITSAPTATIAASTGYAVTLVANEAVSYEKRSGADGDLFGLAGTLLTLPAQAYNAGKVTFSVNLRAIDGAGNATLFTHVVSIAAPPADTRPPVITSALTATVAENSSWTMTLTADEPVTFAKRTGADTASFTLAGAALSLAAQDYEAGKTTFVCNLSAIDSVGNATNFTVTVTISDVVEAALTISGPLTFAAGAAAGTLVFNIAGVPAGVTPVILPNDGRIVVAGDAVNGWKGVTGLTAASAGVTDYAVSAVGAAGATAHVTVTAAATGPFTINDYVVSDNRFEIALSTVPVLRYNAHVSYQVSPPWGIVCPKVLFFGFIGSGTPIGNDSPVEGLYLEVNGTKYWLSGNGSKTVNAATPFTVVNGIHKWTDDLDRAQIYIPPSSDLRFGVAYDMGGEGKVLPGGTALQPASAWKSALGRGDVGNAANTLASRLPLIANNTTELPVGGYGFGNFTGAPVCWVGKPATPEDAAIARAIGLGGMSIDFGAWDVSSPFGTNAAAGMNYGGLARGLYSTVGGRVPRAKMAIPGSRVLDLTNAGDPNHMAGSGGWAKRDAAFAEVGYPWSTFLLGAPINDIANYPGAAAVANLKTATAEVKGRGNRKVVITTARPQTSAQTEGGFTANGMMYTGGDQYQIRGSDAAHVLVDDAIMAGLPNVDAVIDVRPAHESAPGSRKWGHGLQTSLTVPYHGPPTGVVASTANGASGNGSVLTVTAIGGGTIAPTQQLTGTGITSGNRPRIVAQISGTPGGVGEYQLSSTVAVIASQSFTLSGQYQVSLAAKVADGDTVALGPRLEGWPNGNTDAPAVIVDTTVSTVAPFVYTLRGPARQSAAANEAAIVLFTSDGTHLSRASAVREAAIIEQAKVAGIL